MAMRKIFFLSLVIVAMLFFGACKKQTPDNKQNFDKSGQQSGAETTKDRLVEAIKKQKFSNLQSNTIGNAFDSYKYFTKKEWKSESLKSGQFMVDFIGWFDPDTLNDKDVKDGITGRGLDVKFVIEPNGSSFYVLMILKIETKSDDKLYQSQLNDIGSILTNIYANKKIIF
jgi:hypothetical protein